MMMLDHDTHVHAQCSQHMHMIVDSESACLHFALPAFFDVVLRLLLCILAHGETLRLSYPISWFANL